MPFSLTPLTFGLYGFPIPVRDTPNLEFLRNPKSPNLYKTPRSRPKDQSVPPEKYEPNPIYNFSVMSFEYEKRPSPKVPKFRLSKRTCVKLREPAITPQFAGYIKPALTTCPKPFSGFIPAKRI